MVWTNKRTISLTLFVVILIFGSACSRWHVRVKRSENNEVNAVYLLDRSAKNDSGLYVQLEKQRDIEEDSAVLFLIIANKVKIKGFWEGVLYGEGKKYYRFHKEVLRVDREEVALIPIDKKTVHKEVSILDTKHDMYWSYKRYIVDFDLIHRISKADSVQFQVYAKNGRIISGSLYEKERLAFQEFLERVEEVF